MLLNCKGLVVELFISQWCGTVDGQKVEGLLAIPKNLLLRFLTGRICQNFVALNFYWYHMGDKVYGVQFFMHFMGLFIHRKLLNFVYIVFKCNNLHILYATKI